MKTKKITLEKSVYYLITVALIIAIGVKIGQVGQIGAVGYMPGVAFFMISYWLQTMIDEAGHMVLGLLAGYRFISFQVYHWMIIKLSGRLKIKKNSLARTLGRCIMAPPEPDGSIMPVVLFNLGGVIVNLAVSAAGFAFYAAAPGKSMLALFLFVFYVVGLAAALSNAIPITSGYVINDCKNVITLARDPAAMRLDWIRGKMMELRANGTRIKGMPEEWFALPSDADMQNPRFSVLAVLRVSRLVDQLKFEDAKELAERLLSEQVKLTPMNTCAVMLEMIYLELIGQNRPEVIAKYKTEKYLDFEEAMKDSPAVIRVQYAGALISGDTKTADEKMEAFNKVAKSYPYEASIESERELISLAQKAAQAISA